MSVSPKDLQAFLESRSSSVVDGWYAAVRSTAVALGSPSEVRHQLFDVWKEAIAFLLQEEALPRRAESLGATFVSLRVRPQDVGHIPQVLIAVLLEDLPPAVEDVVQARLPGLISGMMTGLFRTGTARLLEEQEEIRAAYGRSLKEAQEELRVKDAGIHSSINAVMLLDMEGRVTYVNPAFLEMWGYQNKREVIGTHVSRYGQWSGDIDQTVEVLERQEGWVGERVALRADGTRFEVYVSASPIRDEAGHVVQIMVFFVDVTERKEAQRALQQRAVQATFLNKIGEEIAGQRTAEAVLARAVKLAQETFDFHQVTALLVDRQSQTLTLGAMAAREESQACESCSRPIGTGITGWVARHRRTALVNDVSRDSRYATCPVKSLAVGSEVAVPISRAGEVMGVLDVQSPQRDAFTADDRVVLETLADQISVALENARLYRALQEELGQRTRAERALRTSVQRLRTMHEIDQSILGAKSTEEIAHVIVSRLHELVPCQRVSIDLFDWRAGEVTVLAAVQTVGEDRASSGSTFPITQHQWLDRLWRSGELADVGDARSLPRSSPLVRAVMEEGIRSFLAAPIGFDDELMGLLTLGSGELNAFGAQHKPIVKELADTAAIAIRQRALFESVQKQKERLRRTMARLAEVEETERRRVVRELHDQVGQNLTALDLSLSVVRSQLENRCLEGLKRRVEDSLSLVEETNDRIRELMLDLRPPVLDDYGLLSALHWYGDRFSARTGIGVKIRGNEVDADQLSPHLENALFRIAQEALNNTAKHAQAEKVYVALKANEQKLRLVISDDGVGFDPRELESKRRSWGMLTMRERAEAVGARCYIESAPSEGTWVAVDVPREIITEAKADKDGRARSSGRESR